MPPFLERRRIRRDSVEYRERQWAWQLCQSPQWRDWLKPMLSQAAERPERRAIGSLDDAFLAAQEHAVIRHAQSLIQRIERLAAEFPRLTVDPTVTAPSNSLD